MSQTSSTPGGQNSQAEQLYSMQLRKERQFKINVALSWLTYLLIIIFLFSGQSFNIGSYTFNTIELDSEFILKEIDFIALGIGETIRISIMSIMLAICLALLAALGRLSKIPPIYALSTFYVSLIRGTPLYLQIFFFYLALPQLDIVLSGTVSGVLALGMNYGAYMSETFRAGISSVGKGQREAAAAIGMTPGQTMRRIILPQALRFAIPPMGNDFISMTKDSALVSALGTVRELMWRATKVGRASFHNFEGLVMAAVFYWIMTLFLTSIQARIEARLSKGDK